MSEQTAISVAPETVAAAPLVVAGETQSSFASSVTVTFATRLLILVGSMGGAPTNPVWVYNLRTNPAVEIRDHTVVQAMRVREVEDEAERARLWDVAVAAYPPYAEYQTRTTRRIPLFVAEPGR